MSAKNITEKLSLSFEQAAIYDNKNTHLDFFLSKRRLVKTSKSHMHTFLELEIILSGKGETNLNGNIYPLQQGTVYFSHPTDVHSIILSEGDTLEILNLSFKQNAFPPELTDMLVYNDSDNIVLLDKNTFSEVVTLYEIACREQNSITSSGSALCTLCAEALLRLVVRSMNAKNSDTRSSCIFEALQYIQLRFRENIRQEDVAKKVGLSTPYFSSVFTKEVGCSYKNYLTNLRISYAKKLIGVSGMRASDACYESGFNSYSSFLKAFTRIVGINPTKYAEIKNHNTQKR